MAFVVRHFDVSDKSNLRVRAKLNAVVDAVNYLLRGGGETRALGTVMPAQTDGVFPVWVVKDGGADGTAIAAATYTYTVKTVDQASELGTAVAVTRQRPYGKMTYYPSGGYGVAFYLNETLVLWDAGEVETTEEECLT
jgi:hypothetical protein